jgi:hypothetical protein
MSYVDRYSSADQTIGHLASIVGTVDVALRAQYVGFAAVCAITVYELALKDVFYDFASKKHLGYGHFVERYFRRVNGNIAIRAIKDEYLPRFGEKYSKRFDSLLSGEEARSLLVQVSVKSSYGNLITWRNEFAHEGRVPTNATFQEVQRSYERGKVVIECLARALTR